MLKRERVLLCAVLLLTALNLFWGLGVAKVQEWDEARRGVSAAEMVDSGDLLVPTYAHQTDLWSTKPPLGLWLIAGSFELLGKNRFALRLPSAVAGFATVVLVIALGGLFTSRAHGLLAGAVLATTYPFLLEHGARAGEYDTVVALLYVLVLWVLLRVRRDVPRAVLVGMLCGLIALVKSFAVVIPLSAIALAACHPRYRAPLLRTLPLTLLVTGAMVAPWIVARYYRDGWIFFQSMAANDLGRVASALEGNGHPFWWYIPRFLKLTFPLSLGLAVIGWAVWRRRLTDDLVLPFAWTLAPLLVASALSTKLSWYILPMYPGFAIVLSAALRAYWEERPRLVLALTVCVLLVAEGRVLRGIARGMSLPAEEQSILALAPGNGAPLCRERWTQALWYVAAVERGYVPQTALVCPLVSGEATPVT